MDHMPALELGFDSTAYSLDALQRAAYRLARSTACDVRVDGTDFVCSLYPVDAETDVSALANELRTLALDEVLRERIRRETAGIRNIILALAFSRTGLVDDVAPPTREPAEGPDLDIDGHTR